MIQIAFLLLSLKSSGFQCVPQFEKFSSEMKLDTISFREEPGSSYKESVFRSLPKKVGVWTEIHLSEKSSPYILQIENDKMLKYSFDSSCSLRVTNELWPAHIEKFFSRTMPEDWGNNDLVNLISTQKKGVIYSWSPKFSYSVLMLPEVERQALSMGYEFISVVDPRASREEILESLKVLPKNIAKKMRALANDKKFNRNVSYDLFMRTAFNHYPVTFVYDKGQLHPRTIIGVMTEVGFRDLANTFVSELK